MAEIPGAGHRSERRLVAILAADIAGYSRLMGEDEAATVRDLKGHQAAVLPTIRVFGGSIIDTAGDGILAQFPSAVRAVECAVAIQRTMAERNQEASEDRRMVFRIGVNLGDIIEDDGRIYGDGVNIAARLEGVCEPGGICLSEDAYRQVRDKVKEQFVDLGEQHLKNIARPVRAYHATCGRSASTSKPAILSARPALPDKPSIAVLPFQNMSGDPEQDYFADGMVEDITTGLSRIKWLFVIARNSSFIYKGRAVDVRQVGSELGVRYVLQGGVRRAGNRLRVSAQLVEAETRAHLWAERFDGGLGDVFDFQDQITDRVVGIVEPSLQRTEIERSRRKRPENLTAYDLYLRAVPHTASQMPEEAAVAITLLDDALRLDPDYPPAHALIAWCHEWRFARAGFQEVHKREGLGHARAVIVSGTDDAASLAIAGFVTILLGGDRDAAISAIERALAINGSCATALYLGAQVHAFLGHSAEAVVLARRALRQSPFDLLAYEAHLAQGMAAIEEARYDDAASHYAKSVQANPRNSSNHLLHAITLALAGRVNAAGPSLQRGLQLEPGFQARWFYEFSTREIADKVAQGARLLGLPV